MSIAARIDFPDTSNAALHSIEREVDFRPSILDLQTDPVIEEPTIKQRPTETLSEGLILSPLLDVPSSETPFHSSGRAAERTPALDPIDANVPETALTRLPYACIGQLVMNFPRHQSVGSAFAIAPDAIMTVGHNLVEHIKDRRTGARRTETAKAVRFSPGYNGLGHGAKFGTWTADWAMVCIDWVNASDHRYDMAIVHMKRNSSGSLSETIGGHLPLGHYPDYYSQWSLFGYPFIASSNDNPQMRQVNSVGAGADTSWPKDQPVATRSTVFRAMSGGPWFSNFDPKNPDTFRVLGMNTYTRKFVYQYSVYFGDMLRALAEEYKSELARASA